MLFYRALKSSRRDPPGKTATFGARTNLDNKKKVIILDFLDIAARITRTVICKKGQTKSFISLGCHISLRKIKTLLETF